MVFNVFLDANVILDVSLQREGNEEARLILELAISRKIKAYVTPSVIHIVGYWLTKSFGAEQAREMILALLNDVQSIDISHGSVIQALHSKIGGIEDSLQYHAALNKRLDFFISKDKKLKNQSLPILPVYSAKEFGETYFG